MKSKCRGFTLIEIMVVVVIVAILSAIAIPSYKDYVIRARITQALRWLSTAQPRMEQCYQDNRAYKTGSVDCCDKVAETADDFTFTCDSDTATYTLTATGKGTMTGFAYTLDQADARATSAAPAGWSTGACWIAKKGQTC